MITTRTREICSNCGSSFIIEDEDGQPYCLLCRRPYTKINFNQVYGRLGGLQTYLRYGRHKMREWGKMGGRPKLRQLPSLEINKEERGHTALNTNSLKELKKLYAIKLQRRL